MSQQTAAVLLGLISAVCYAAAAVLQEQLAATITARGRGRPRVLLLSGRWWTAVGMLGTGALLHAVALGLGPLTVVQPLGVLTLVAAAPIAAVFVNRPVSAAAWRGILLTSVGLAGVLLLAGSVSGTSEALDSGEQLALAGTVAGVLALLIGTGAVAGQRMVAVRTMSLASASGISYGAASVYVKTVADTWTKLSLVQLISLVLVTVVLALAGLGASQASYRGAGLAAPLATMTVVNPVMAGTVGVLLLGEGFGHGAAGQLAALGAGLAVVAGLVLLAAEAATSRNGPTAHVPARRSPTVPPENLRPNPPVATSADGGSTPAEHPRVPATRRGRRRSIK